jgi:hypothetical protein
MANEALDPKEPRGAAARIDPPALSDDTADPMLAALGYEAADPALLAVLWGEPVTELRA